MGAGHQAKPLCDQRVGLGASANISLQGVGWRVRERVQARDLRAHPSCLCNEPPVKASVHQAPASCLVYEHSCTTKAMHPDPTTSGGHRSHAFEALPYLALRVSSLDLFQLAPIVSVTRSSA